jgi:uncharacterized protein (DUF433 family)
MSLTPPTIEIPLRTDEYGTIRIGETHITLETIIAAHQRGDTPQEIVDGFPSLELADVYALIAYYLQHQKNIDNYIRQQDKKADQLRHEIETNRPDMLEGQKKFRALLDKRNHKQD